MQKSKIYFPMWAEMFLRESNWIEGEYEIKNPYTFPCPINLLPIGRLNPGDLAAFTYACKSMHEKMTEKMIKEIHHLFGDHLKKPWVGKYRDCSVSVGGKIMPHHSGIPLHMKGYVKNWGKLDAWEIHYIFEQIHPFQDLNGRVGRLLWLIKMMEDGWMGEMPFLQQYYYQTLSHV